MKTCTSCAKTKPYADFSREPRMADGYRGQCKRCRQDRSNARRKPNPKVGQSFTRDCDGCGVPFTYVYTKGGSTRQRFCSAKCRSAEFHNRNGRDYVLLRKYGLPIGGYDQLISKQGGGCAICGMLPDAGSLYVDHDHGCCPGRRSCGECIRGLLCAHCNFGIGHFGDSPDLMTAAADYLRVERQMAASA